MDRKRKPLQHRWWVRLLALGLLGLAGFAIWYWWDIQHFAPDEAAFSEQGISVGERHGHVGFDTARALGASFAYLEASAGTSQRDAQFAANLASARRAGLLSGGVHRFDPCSGADGQSANFVTMVPRDPDLLPPAIAFEWVADDCETPVSDAALESELLTFINQVEMHSGKPVILRISEEFEARYGLAGRIERDLWLVRDRFQPRYAGRPWLLWTANTARRSEISDVPVEWVVVQP